jgi:hypothetical protein
MCMTSASHPWDLMSRGTSPSGFVDAFYTSLVEGADSAGENHAGVIWFGISGSNRFRWPDGSFPTSPAPTSPVSSTPM